MEEIIKKAKELRELIDKNEDIPQNGSCILLIFSEDNVTAHYGVKGSKFDLVVTLHSALKNCPGLNSIFKLILNHK